MQKTKFQQAIFEVLTKEYEHSISLYDEHKFSLQFEKKMRKLIKRREKPYYEIINTIGKRVVCAAIAIIIASSVAIMSVDAIRNVFY